MARKVKSYYPVFLDLTGRLAVVVGGGEVAERKARTLADYGADVVVIAPEATQTIRSMQIEGLVTIESREYVRGDLSGAAICVCATDSEEVNRAVWEEARGSGCLVNVVDVPELCDFIVPSIVRRGPLQIAISTGGAAPAVSKRLRRRLREDYGAEWGEYVSLLGEVRGLAFERIADEAERKSLFERIADSDVLDRLRAGEVLSAESVYQEFAD